MPRPPSTSSPWRAATRHVRMRTRRRGRLRAPTAPTRRCSRTTRSRRSTSPCRTRCTASGRSRRSRRASTCSARSRCRATPTRSRLRAKQLVADGAIGELLLVRSTFGYSLYDEDNIRLRTDVEGGALMDVGCYNVSGSRLFAGEPEHVKGEAWFGPSGTDWVFAATLRFPDDVVALFDCGTAMPERDELEAIGSEGSLFLDDPWHCNRPVIEVRRADGVERIEIEHEDSYRLELENVSAAARGEAELLLGREDAVGQARALEALHASATDGGPVKL